MTKSIQIRNVPENVHRKLKARAAEAGLSLSDFLLTEMTRFAELPTREEMRDRLRRKVRGKLTPSAAKLVRKERDSA